MSPPTSSVSSSWISNAARSSSNGARMRLAVLARRAITPCQQRRRYWRGLPLQPRQQQRPDCHIDTRNTRTASYEFGLLPGCQLKCTYRYVVASKSCAAFDACGHLIHASTNEFRVRGKAKKTNAPTRAVTAVIPETMIASSALAMFRITPGQAPQPISRSPQLTAGNTP